MGADALLTVLATPDWWFDTWSPGDWLATLFNQPVEVHTFELGALLGVVLATLVVLRRQRPALLVTLVVVLFSFGVLETTGICPDLYSACQHVQLKPWYFMGGFVGAHLFMLGLFGLLSGDRAPPEAEVESAAAPLAGVVVVAVLAISLYSFLTARPVHPITGLAAVGGFVGSVLGLAGYRWATEDSPEGFRTAVGQVLRREVDGADLVVGYGMVLGFAYPRVLWELGMVTGSDWLFGTIRWAEGGLLSVVTYVFVLFLVSLVQLSQNVRRADGRLDGSPVAAVVFAYVFYAACLFVATGYANRLWYHLIPSARP